MALPSEADGRAPLHGCLGVDVVATADAAGCPAHHPIAQAWSCGAAGWTFCAWCWGTLATESDKCCVWWSARTWGEPRDCFVFANKMPQARNGAGLVIDEPHNDKGPDAIENRDKESKRKRRIRQRSRATPPSSSPWSAADDQRRMGDNAITLSCTASCPSVRASESTPPSTSCMAMTPSRSHRRRGTTTSATTLWTFA